MKIGIIGLGLIGGSVFKALSKSGKHEFYLVTGNKETVKKTEKCCKIAGSDYNILKECEIVFVCTPMKNMNETLDKLENFVKKECIVADTASIKGFVRKKSRPYRFIPTHPMAGTENSGFDASSAELFIGAKWVITPFEYKNTEIIEELIKETGAKPIITTPEKHDEAVALISHFPMFLSQVLFKTAEDNELALKLASSGFRDTTRLAMTNSVLAEDMLNFNGENIEKALKKFNFECENIKIGYSEKIKAVAEKRRKMYSENGKNIL